MWPDLLAFAGVMALGQFSPGPDLLLLTRTSLAQGRTAGWWTTAGIATGLCVHAAIAILGMAYLMSQGGWLTTALRWGAAAYLGKLGYSLLRGAILMRAANPAEAAGAQATDRRSAYLRGLLCNILNPKVALFFAAVVAEFVTGSRPAWWSAALWGVIVGEGLILWAVYVWFLQFPPFQRAYLLASRWIDLAFGVGLLSLALVLLVNGQG